MKLCITAALLLAAFSIGTGNGVAEQCDELGCEGLVRYVFIPTALFQPDKRTTFLLNGDQQAKCLAGDDNPFGGTALPEINSVQSVKRPTALYDEKDLQGRLSEFRPDYAVRVTGTSCRVLWMEPRAGDLSKGGEVRILGYRTLLGHYTVKGTVRTATFPEQLLFAMVLIRKD